MLMLTEMPSGQGFIAHLLPSNSPNTVNKNHSIEHSQEDMIIIETTAIH